MVFETHLELLHVHTSTKPKKWKEEIGCTTHAKPRCQSIFAKGIETDIGGTEI